MIRYLTGKKETHKELTTIWKEALPHFGNRNENNYILILKPILTIKMKMFCKTFYVGQQWYSHITDEIKWMQYL